jgi:hypothetical protein
VLSGLGSQAHAQGTAARPEPLRSVGLFSLLGDTIQIVQAPDPTDTRIDRNQRDSLDVKNIGLDQVALRTLSSGLGQMQPQAKLQMFRSPAPIPLADQRAIADGAHKAELPGWIVELINRHRFSHVLLLTRHRGAAMMRTSDGNALGRGTVEGIGFYIDPLYEIFNRTTKVSMIGALCAYIDVRLTLMDAMSGQLLTEQHVRDGLIYGAQTTEQSTQVWDILGPQQKAKALHDLLQENLTRVLPAMLKAAGQS